jgi:hypothetical protein
MKRKILIIVTVVIMLMLIPSIYLNIISFAFTEKETSFLLVKETSPNSNYSVEIVQNGVPFTFGSHTVVVSVFDMRINNGSRVFTTKIKNDGKALNSSNYGIEWLDDAVKITLSGEEQRDSVFVIPF